MEASTVPKKVNRNVLKALSILQSSRTDFVRLNAITRQVQIQMRNCVPVANIEDVVRESLCTLTKLGILMRLGMSKYALSYPVFCRLGRALPNPNTNVPGNPGKPLRKAVQEARRKKSLGHLDPWKPATKLLSEESLSGNEMDKMRKRMRTNTKRIQKKKRNVAQPQPGPKQDDPAGIENEIMDPKPLFGPSGSTTPDIPVPSGTTSDPHKLSGANEWDTQKPFFGSPQRKYSKLNAQIPDTSLQSGNLSSRFSRDMSPGVCPHGFLLIPRKCTSTSEIVNKVDVNEDEGSEASKSSSICSTIPIGLDVQSAGYTGLEPDVENASMVGLCGSPQNMRTRAEQYVTHYVVLDEDKLPTTNQGPVIPVGEQIVICEDPISLPRESNSQESISKGFILSSYPQDNTLLTDGHVKISQSLNFHTELEPQDGNNQEAPNAVFLDVPNSISENAENTPDQISQSEEYEVKVSQSLNFQTEQPSVLKKLRRSVSEFDFYK
ncbi:uncharacterized protein LOC119560861 [Drosophila subpulchrella]|uniref:uncharacterized protein LOC119560861 n=1 Tax=Drosophila subpulchrella TaxID=1486046 RepID=UPI0018A1A762|nr:uncharacterized protein LOC119560861 [Drosophila subpulchrella]